MIEIGKCYKNSEGSIRGPMRPYGFLIQDHQGFPFFRNGDYFSSLKPERCIIFECECPKRKQEEGEAPKGEG